MRVGLNRCTSTSTGSVYESSTVYPPRRDVDVLASSPQHRRTAIGGSTPKKNPMDGLNGSTYRPGRM
jgi:hypothetical protein